MTNYTKLSQVDSPHEAEDKELSDYNEEDFEIRRLSEGSDRYDVISVKVACQGLTTLAGTPHSVNSVSSPSPSKSPIVGLMERFGVHLWSTKNKEVAKSVSTSPVPAPQLG